MMDLCFYVRTAIFHKTKTSRHDFMFSKGLYIEAKQDFWNPHH